MDKYPDSLTDFIGTELYRTSEILSRQNHAKPAKLFTNKVYPKERKTKAVVEKWPLVPLSLSLLGAFRKSFIVNSESVCLK